MKWFKRLMVLVVVLIAALAVIPLFISLDDYRPDIEKKASDALKEPVRLKSLKLSGLPLPHLRIEGIEVGKGGDIKVGHVVVTPDLWSLLGETKVVRSIEIADLVVKQSALDKIPLWTRTDPKAPPSALKVRINGIRLDNALLQLQKSKFGPFDARIALSASGMPEHADITLRDGTLKAVLKPSGPNIGIDVQAKGWRPPAGPAILFDELHIKGVANQNDANLSDVRALLYGGTIAGKTTVSWQKGLQLKGDYAVDAVELRDLVPLFSPDTKISGRLTGRPVFSANAPGADQLKNYLKVDTPFDIRDGVLHGIDIHKAATSLITKDSSGQTRFDVLSGNYALNRGTQQISNLKIASGSLAADGNVTIAPNKALSGRINAQVKAGSIAAASIPLNISGTLDEPRALPTGATVGGAAVGTAILGPGLGTSLGAKVGGWADNLFGGGKDAKKK